jgi:gliding motility-associated-like protein
MKKVINILFFLFYVSILNAQIVYYQETCKCGVTGAGFSTGLGSGSGTFSIHIEPGSTIKKAFLFGVKYGDFNQNILPADIILNSDTITFNETYSTGLSFNAFGANWLAKNINIHSIDVSNIIDPTINNYSIKIPTQLGNCTVCQYNCIYLYVLYENPLLTQNITSYILLNNKDEFFYVDYELPNFNPIFASSPIGFATYLDRLVGVFQDPNDGSRLLFFDGVWTNIGLLKGADNANSSWNEGGVKGHFYFQNNQLYGLDDDTPDNIVGGTDGLLDASGYLQSNGTLKWRLQWEMASSAGKYNIYNGFFIEHSTPCDTFSVSVPSDTTICRGESLQLNVTGGSQYEWQPATDLSCSSCPNPVFTGDSTQLYTVRIWNNDSCSVVRPVKISVRNQPNFGNINLTPSICGAATGAVSASSIAGNIPTVSFNLDGGTSQSSGAFSSLGAGTHTITIKDGYGCKRDSVVSIGQVNNTIAQFSANPITGAVPFSVSLSNSSVFADQFLWSLNGVYQGGTFSNFTAIQTGSYLIELIAWQFDPACADTATLSITAFDSLMVQVPNIITANDDLINDFFSLITNLPLKGAVSILNRWGEVVYTYNGTFQQGQTVLWDGKFDGKNVTEGTYFYAIKLNEDPEFPLAIDKSQLPLKLEGFVEVRR